jgi:hypothetical protein
LEIAHLNQSSLPAWAFAFQVEALNFQMREHFVPAWSADRWRAVGLSYRLPGGDVPWICAPYPSANDLPPGKFWPITITDQVPEGELGDHDYFQGLISARAKANLADPLDATVASHEDTELRGDPNTNGWVDVPGLGYAVATESSDPTENDWYTITIDLFGDRREVKVSNFVLPAWFAPGAARPYDYMGLCTRPLELRPGGYVITMKDGQISQQFGSHATRARFIAKLGQPRSRTARRIATATTGAPPIRP